MSQYETVLFFASFLIDRNRATLFGSNRPHTSSPFLFTTHITLTVCNSLFVSRLFIQARGVYLSKLHPLLLFFYNFCISEDQKKWLQRLTCKTRQCPRQLQNRLVKMLNHVVNLLPLRISQQQQHCQHREMKSCKGWQSK